MGDTDYHTIALIWLRQALEDCFAGVLDVYVAMNLILYFEQGNPSARRDPDILVARGVGKHRRRSFRVWEEKVVPCTLFEVVSEGTWREDVGEKRMLYARIGVNEYFVFDPEGRFVDLPLQGFKLENGKSVAMTPEPDGSLISLELGLRLVAEGGMLRVIDLKSGCLVPTHDELAAEVGRLRQLLGQREQTKE
jgi:Uma2 family endonuclease